MAWREAVGLEPVAVAFVCPVCRSTSFFQTAEGYYVRTAPMARAKPPCRCATCASRSRKTTARSK